MALTPVEIRHLSPAKGFVGATRARPIDRLLDEIVASFEDVWRERADLADKVEQLESISFAIASSNRCCARRSCRPKRRASR